MSRVVLYSTEPPTDEPSEGELFLLVVDNVFYAWIGGQAPVPLTMGGAFTPEMWTAQFGGTIEAPPPPEQGFDTNLSLPYPIALPSPYLQINANAVQNPEPILQPYAFVTRMSVYVVENTLDADCTLVCNGFSDEIVLPSGQGDYSASIVPKGAITLLSNGSTLEVYATSPATTGKITLAVTVALRLQSSNNEPAAQPTGST